MRLMRLTSLFAAGLLSGCAEFGAPDFSNLDVRNIWTDERDAFDPEAPPEEGQLAPVLTGLGDHSHRVTTNSERSQYFFDQGLRLTYGFNHAEARRAFQESARADPKNAMAYWGEAFILGPNLNMPMQPDDVAPAYEAVQKALALKLEVSENERAYIEALALRYSDDPNADRAAMDRAFADAMAGVNQRFPDDLDAATIYADALMNLSPWNYWEPDGAPRENTETILATLESVIEEDPEHAGALHLHIHALEARDPAAAEESADRLAGLTPGAGHLIHMPSHIYVWTGRYADSVRTNEEAVKVDEGYIAQCQAQGFYPLLYYPHNIHFLNWSAAMAGQSEVAINSARRIVERIPTDLDPNVIALYQFFLALPQVTLVRFGKWDEILAEPMPREDARYLVAIWHYGRGLAYLNKQNYRSARSELAKLKSIRDELENAGTMIGLNDATPLATIATEVLSGEIAAATGDDETGIAHLERAVRIEEGLTYDDPPNWYFPVRHTLGAVLLEAGYAKEAETVYWADLKQNVENGYALYGLAQSLRAQNKEAEADEIEQRYTKAFAEADVTLKSSRF